MVRYPRSAKRSATLCVWLSSPQKWCTTTMPGPCDGGPVSAGLARYARTVSSPTGQATIPPAACTRPRPQVARRRDTVAGRHRHTRPLVGVPASGFIGAPSSELAGCGLLLEREPPRLDRTLAVAVGVLGA